MALVARQHLDAEIDRLSRQFAADLVELVRRAVLEDVEKALDAPVPRQRAKQKLASFVLPRPDAAPRKARPAPNSFEHYERMALERALDVTGGNKASAARLLRMGQSSFYRRLTVLGIPLDWSPSRASPPTGEGLLSLDQAERMALQHALDAAGGHWLRAAELLGVGKSTLYRKLRKQGPKMARR